VYLEFAASALKRPPKEIAPRVTRAAVLRDSANPAGIAQFGAIRAAASSLGVDVSPIDVRDAGEIERAVAAFARSADGGLIVTGRGLQQSLPSHRRRPDLLWACPLGHQSRAMETL